MKVLVHLNHSRNKSYLLSFPKKTKVRKILEGDCHDLAIKKLLAHSSRRVHIPEKHKQKVQNLAHFTISQCGGYIAERLA